MPLITDGDIRKGFMRRRRIFTFLFPEEESEISSNEIPKMAYEYARKMSNFLGKPLDEVLNSQPVRSYVRKLEEKVKLR